MIEGGSCNPNARLKTDSPRAAVTTRLLSPSISFSSTSFFGGNQLSLPLSSARVIGFSVVSLEHDSLCAHACFTRDPCPKLCTGRPLVGGFEKRKPLYYTAVEIFIHIRFASSRFLNAGSMLKYKRRRAQFTRKGFII